MPKIRSFQSPLLEAFESMATRLIAALSLSFKRFRSRREVPFAALKLVCKDFNVSWKNLQTIESARYLQSRFHISVARAERIRSIRNWGRQSVCHISEPTFKIKKPIFNLRRELENVGLDNPLL